MLAQSSRQSSLSILKSIIPNEKSQTHGHSPAEKLHRLHNGFVEEGSKFCRKKHDVPSDFHTDTPACLPLNDSTASKCIVPQSQICVQKKKKKKKRRGTTCDDSKIIGDYKPIDKFSSRLCWNPQYQIYDSIHRVLPDPVYAEPDDTQEKLHSSGKIPSGSPMPGQ